jgi:hypothetical protein
LDQEIQEGERMSVLKLDIPPRTEEEKEQLRRWDLEFRGICPDCGGLIAIRNPTGKCDHLYYPDYKRYDK